MFACHVDCYPWDVLDEGIEDVLERLQDQVGATGVTLAVAGDELEQFRPHHRADPCIYRTAGGVYFQPNDKHYQATRFKPPLWEQHRKMDAVAKISDHLSERQLDLRLSICPFASQRLVHKHPEAACKNAFGIASRSTLCPANPDVQEYLLSLVRDLSTYDDASAIVLDEVQTPTATDSAPFVQALAMFDTDLVDLLGVCFCESCLQGAAAAGVDGQAARRCVHAVLDRLFHEGKPQDWNTSQLLLDNPAIGEFVAWSERVLVELYGRIKAVSSKAVILSFRNTGKVVLELHTAPELFETVDRIIIDHDDMQQIIGELSHGDAWSGVLTPASLQRMELLLRMDEGSIDEAPDVVRQLSWAAEAGSSGAVVSHYGAILEYQLDWIHQGLRHARRLASP